MGFSAGAMCAAAIASATLARPWRLRARLALIGYCVGAILVPGQLADVEHLIAVLAGLPMGRAFLRRGTASAVAPGEVADLVQAQHGGGSLSWMTTWPGTRYLIADDGYLAYRVHAGVAITVGEPGGSVEWRARALAEFAGFCERSGLVPCGFSVGSSTVDSVRPLGWRHVQVAKDTLIEHRMITLAHASPSIIAQVREVSAGWLRGKRMPELGYTLGGVDEAMDPRVRVGAAAGGDSRAATRRGWSTTFGPSIEVEFLVVTQDELFSVGPGDLHAWADSMLAPLDLSVELLHQVIEAGQRRRAAASPLAPTMAAAIEQWSAMVAELRSRTSWRADEVGGLPRTIHPSGRFFVVVRAGAGDVGAIEPVVPTTKHRLGPMLCKLIDGLPPSTIPLFNVDLGQIDPDAYHEPTPWLLLVASRDGALHSELSQPARRDGEVITGYTQRIPLPPITVGAATVELSDVGDAGPELDIQPLP